MRRLDQDGGEKDPSDARAEKDLEGGKRVLGLRGGLGAARGRYTATRAMPIVNTSDAIGTVIAPYASRRTPARYEVTMNAMEPRSRDLG